MRGYCGIGHRRSDSANSILCHGAITWRGVQTRTQRQHRVGPWWRARPPAALRGDLCVDLVWKRWKKSTFQPGSTCDRVREAIRPESAAQSQEAFQQNPEASSRSRSCFWAARPTAVGCSYDLVMTRLQNVHAVACVCVCRGEGGHTCAEVHEIDRDRL